MLQYVPLTLHGVPRVRSLHYSVLMQRCALAAEGRERRHPVKKARIGRYMNTSERGTAFRETCAAAPEPSPPRLGPLGTQPFTFRQGAWGRVMVPVVIVHSAARVVHSAQHPKN